jgi:hypothetical protein
MTAPGSPRLAIALALASLAAAPAARAQETIEAGPKGEPPAAEAVPRPSPAAPARDRESDEAIGRWARGVLAGAPSAGEPGEAASRPGCAPPADRRPHGQVWAGIGTGGYREAGAVVTKPLGDCGQVTIAVDKLEMGAPRRRR